MKVELIYEVLTFNNKRRYQLYENQHIIVP